MLKNDFDASLRGISDTVLRSRPRSERQKMVELRGLLELFNSLLGSHLPVRHSFPSPVAGSRRLWVTAGLSFRGTVLSGIVGSPGPLPNHPSPTVPCYEVTAGT